MPRNYLHLQDNFYKRFDGAVSKTVLLKEFENKVFLTNLFFYLHQPPKAASTTPEGGDRGVYRL